MCPTGWQVDPDAPTCWITVYWWLPPSTKIMNLKNSIAWFLRHELCHDRWQLYVTVLNFGYTYKLIFELLAFYPWNNSSGWKWGWSWGNSFFKSGVLFDPALVPAVGDWAMNQTEALLALALQQGEEDSWCRRHFKEGKCFMNWTTQRIWWCPPRGSLGLGSREGFWRPCHWSKGLGGLGECISSRDPVQKLRRKLAWCSEGRADSA